MKIICMKNWKVPHSTSAAGLSVDYSASVITMEISIPKAR